MSLVTIKVSLNDEKYINWKNNKNSKKENGSKTKENTTKNNTELNRENEREKENERSRERERERERDREKEKNSIGKNKLPNVKSNDDNSICDMRKLFRPETMSDGMLQLYQPFGSTKVFTTIDQMYCDKYNDVTAKKCGWCTLSFTHYPTVIPYNVQKKNTRIQQVHNAPTKPILRDDAFVCKGCYCSFNCAMAQICDSLDTDKARQKELLYTLFRLSGYSNDDIIIPSPDKELMIDYGGILSCEEYTALIGSKNKFQLTYPHIICIGARIARVKIYSS